MWRSLPAQGLLASSSAETPLAPHYGTQAAVKAVQTAFTAATDQLTHLPGFHKVTFPNFTGARPTGVYLGQVAFDSAVKMYHANPPSPGMALFQALSALLCGCAVEAAYAGALSQAAAALSSAAAPWNQLTGSLTRQLLVRPPKRYLHYFIL